MGFRSCGEQFGLFSEKIVLVAMGMMKDAWVDVGRPVRRK